MAVLVMDGDGDGLLVDAIFGWVSFARQKVYGISEIKWSDRKVVGGKACMGCAGHAYANM